MRRIPAAAGSVALLAALATACSSGDAAPAGGSGPATYDLPARTARPGETVLHRPTVRSGDMAFTVIGLRGRMNTVAGSHADVPPEGQFIRIRLVVENTGRITSTFDTRKQLLVASDGRVFRPDLDAMLIRRQPTSLDVGSGVRVEMDLWYDVPRQVKEAALRVVGSPTMGAAADPPLADVRLG
ncbi:MAG TPA: DUF4352 domain-containing protein [Streptosporangiaceae bacterium]|jgi:hypothetical protein|nr:DUF4352 domain-containing protein [Streptosporangiaceae bacterium]